MTAIVTQGDAGRLHLPDETVDLIVTSPPYFGLRSYQDGGEHYDGQIGAEATPAEYLDALMACTAEWMRVLKPGGSIFVNLGDKYGSAKSLLNLPARYAIQCTEKLDLLQRAEIVWGKSNKFIDSKARDRVRRTHEVLLHFTLGPNYYENVDAVRVQPTSNYQDRPQYRRAMELFSGAGFTEAHMDAVRAVGIIDSHGGQVRSGGSWSSTSGRLALEVQAVLKSYYRELCGSSAAPRGTVPGSVWDIPAYPFKAPEHLEIKHTAAFPPELVRAPILGWSPPGGVVLDPFGGTGTTALVASVHGRVGISVDLSADYCRLAQWRTTDEKQRAKAAGTKPKPVKKSKPELLADVIDLPAGQIDLFGEEIA